MSSGHSKDQVLPGVSASLYERAQRDPEFQEYLKRDFRVDRSKRIPYLGGYSKDGRIIYIDSEFDLDALVPALVEHENYEKTAIDVWHLSYWYAHGLATYAENRFALSKLHIRPALYEKRLVPYIQHDEEEEDEVALPANLDRTPYNAPDEPPKAGRFPSTALLHKRTPFG
jgi:hypothetical protein